MSFLPIFNSSMAGLILVSLFLWKVWAIPLIVLMVVTSICWFWFDLMSNDFHYVSAFWLFIFSEVLAFGSILLCCFWFDTCSFVNLSSPLELPLLGCFLLLGSSITVTGFHHLLSWEWSWVLLVLTILLGIAFVFMQLAEMNDISMNIFDTSFHASSFCTVGLHFSHVLLGIIGLSTILFIGVAQAGEYRCTVVTWYWHFVDYVWLFVYTFVYVC
uniref:Cytochrome c oxidase subunit 3 n=3 Tax=unclassified Rhinebothroides TaxID=2627538 RepID=A0A8K1SXD2_9CEST|nr:cytochrome c oxidase subunit III [Rhinebothroides sp. MZUSP 8020]UFQ88863.1 cytochrome c oxidase subunit III [Rhinebothroides sp. MZUSP 8021]UFQ88923.1 cytochrome c oxidase subunit III [Rhinebothroides sp. MZUSP 8026]